ncbi:competence protein CoiA family protein, partial [Rhizobium phaseoli]
MKLAVVNGVRREAAPALVGTCPGCEAPVIPKCGEIRLHHWAHRSTISCDPWREAETEWHRAWKNHFPIEWQEVWHRGADGVVHIADVKTPNSAVLEFQHSPISAEERVSREAFYRPMVWVVDGKDLTLRATVTDTGKYGTGLALDAAAKRLYVTNADGELVTIDTQSNKVLSRKKLDEAKEHFFL